MASLPIKRFNVISTSAPFSSSCLLKSASISIPLSLKFIFTKTSIIFTQSTYLFYHKIKTAVNCAAIVLSGRYSAFICIFSCPSLFLSGRRFRLFFYLFLIFFFPQHQILLLAPFPSGKLRRSGESSEGNRGFPQPFPRYPHFFQAQTA